MVEASNIKKMTKKVINYMDEVVSSKSKEERDEAVSELLEFLESNQESLSGISDPDVSEMISSLFQDLEDAEEDSIERLIDYSSRIDPENLALKSARVELFFRRGDYDRVIQSVVEDGNLCGIQKCNDALRESAQKTSSYVDAVLHFSKCGKFDDLLFKAYLESQENNEVDLQIIRNYKIEDHRDKLIEFLEELTRVNEDYSYLVELADAYRHSDSKEALKRVLDKIDEATISDSGFLQRIALNFEYLEDYRRTLLVAKRGLEIENDNLLLLKIRSKALSKIESDKDAIESYEELLRRYPDDKESLRDIIDLYYKIKNYEQTLKYLVDLKEVDKYDLSDVLKKIDCEINLSKFDDAIKDVNSALSEFGDNIDVLRYKFSLEKIVHDPSYVYHTAEKILQLYPNEMDATIFVLDYLYESNEYKMFLEKFDQIESEEIKKNYIDKRISCLLNVDEFEYAMDLLSKDKKLLCSDSVLDAVFFNVREDWQIEEIIKTMNGEVTVDFQIPLVVLYKLQGKRFSVTTEITNFLQDSKSVAIASIIALDNIDFEKRIIPDFVNDFISKPKFKQVSEIVDIILSIHAKKFSEDWRDSPKFLYPLVNAFASIGEYDSARKELERAYESKRTDPFYYYYDALIDFRTDKVSAAGKSLAKASAMLTNVLFLNLSLEINLKEERTKDALEDIETVIKMKEPKSINFEVIYNFVKERMDSEFSNRFLELMEINQISNIWIYRIKRDLYLSQDDRVKAEEFSQIISEDPNRSLDDVMIHSKILEANGKLEERLKFLQESTKIIEDPIIDIWIGDFYYSEKEFDKALDYYKEAIEKGVDPLEIINYPDSLIETGTYEEAGNIIKKMKDPGALRIKLYYKTGNIQKIVELLKNVVVRRKEDEEQISYISRILWRNREVRDTLLKMYEDEGHLFLGKLITQRMLESQEYKKAVEIMRNILKNYPDDLENVNALSGALIETGEVDEAVSVLTKSLKYSKNFDESMSIIEPLMRIYYEERDYDSVVKFYETNKDYVNSAVIQYVVRSYIAIEDFDSADKLMGKFEGSLLGTDVVKELSDELKIKQEFVETLEYVNRLLRLEYKAGKVFDLNEAVYKAEIPLEKVESVFDFLKGEDYYFEINEEKYEILSRDVIQNVVKHTTAETISDVKINTIFNNLDRRDPIVAKNLYIYIKKSLEKKREPKIHDDELTSLLRIALKESLRPEPLNVAFALRIGISEAMEVLTLMNYMSRLNEQGGF